MPSLFTEEALRARPRGEKSPAQLLEYAQDRARTSRAAMRALLETGGSLERMVISTHLKPGLQEAASHALDADCRLRDAPRVLLVSPRYPATHADFVASADALYFSESGEFNWLSLPREVFLIGGFEQACLINTIERLVGQVALRNRADFTLHVLADHTYSLFDTSYRDLRDAPDRSVEDVIDHVEEVLPFGRVRPETVTIGSNRIAFDFVNSRFKRKRDVHTIRVVIE